MNTQERRKSPRKKVAHPIPVVDQDREHVLGHLVNVSQKGFMLLSPAPLDINRVFQLRIELPQICGGEVIPLGAESLWREVSSSPGKYWVGFQIIDISPESSQRIRKLIEEHL
ncbi:MAG: PilZ protein [Proteobacteria bacterium]|nr:PilZ protein [Pseudomonadota bacterium]